MNKSEHIDNDLEISFSTLLKKMTLKVEWSTEVQGY